MSTGQRRVRPRAVAGGGVCATLTTWWSHPHWLGHCAFFVMVMLSSPSFAQFDGQPWGGAETASGGLFWDRGFGAPAVPSKDDPSFDYPLPTQDAGRGKGGSTWPPPGYSSYPGTAVPAYGGLPVDVEAPAHDRDRGGDADRPGGQGPWSGSGQQGYRFRGDEKPGDSAWQESPYAPGYRFRPLTEVEQDRSSNADGWRPMERGEGRPAERPAPQSDAFGYRSDSWFSKYYGERP